MLHLEGFTQRDWTRAVLVLQVFIVLTKLERSNCNACDSQHVLTTLVTASADGLEVSRQRTFKRCFESDFPLSFHDTCLFPGSGPQRAAQRGSRNVAL